MSRLPPLAEIARVGSTPLPFEPACPADRKDPVYLLDASTGLEERLLRSWIERCHAEATSVMSLAPSRIRRRFRRTDPRLETVLGEPNRWLIPLRVVWMPTERHGRRIVSWLDVVKLGDPRDPRWFRDYLILRLRPDRVRIVVGDGASSEDLATAHHESVENLGIVEFVTRRAWRALDRAERRERGNRYKIPKFVAEDIVTDPEFRRQVVALGGERGLPEAVAIARARHYVAEIAASHSPFVIDLIANLIHWIYRQGYGAIRYDRRDVARIAELGRDHPVAFLPSHRSNLDRLALQFMLWENDLPPNHTAGGINMNFFPVGPLIRRTGVFFIRRSFRDNDLYKFVVKTYLDYLIEKRFPLEWYIEGGRSRSGKLRPPRFGMLAWVVDSWHRGSAEDVFLLPISIAYDQIQDVDAYATEATGGAKETEGLSWALRLIASLRRRYGDIHITFAQPISLSAGLAGANLDDDNNIEVQKLAFEVMYRIGSVTPITPTAVVSIALLAAKGRALDIDAITESCSQLTAYITRRRLPTTTDLIFSSPDATRAVVAGMAGHGLVSSHDAGGRTVWWMEPGQMLRASYYRNTVVHFFVPRGLAEIAFESSDLDGFWKRLLDLRDLLKFEFFFADKEEFQTRVAVELTEEVPDWKGRVAKGDGGSIRLAPTTAAWTLLPILESYAIVADELADHIGVLDEKAFLAACLKRGRLYRLEGRISSDEAVSQVQFGGALLLAENRGLLAEDAEGRARQEFARQVWAYISAVG
ncbi:MAG: 1-acyl-sn-glycerol-3-phosphate acyltransferase [Acidimicrobiia bacterium]